MAYDKVIDSTLLDAGLAATANAIRAKTGDSSPIAWDSANGFKAAVEGIDTEGGVELPELGDTAAQPTDMAADKVLYDDAGNPVTGTLAEITSGAALSASDNATVAGSASTGIRIKAQRSDGSDYILRSGAYMMAAAPANQFGDAAADQVAKGATFTSAAGLLVEGNIVDVDDYQKDAAWNNISLSNPYTSYDYEDESYLLYADCTLKNDTIFRKNVVIPICSANGYQLGEARPEDVRAGVTFTSGKAGLKVTGIMEVGSGSGDSMGSDIAGVSKFTLAEDATVAGAFVKLGNVPWIAEHINDANLYVNLFSLNTSLKTDGSVFNAVSSNKNCINGSYSGAMYRSQYLSFVSFSSQPFNNTTNTGSVRLCGDGNGDVYIAAYSDQFFAAGEYALLYGLI